MRTLVVPADGVNEKLKLLELFVQVDPPFVEYAVAVLADGVAELLILQVVAAVLFDHALCGYVVQESVGAGGAALSTLIT